MFTPLLRLEGKATPPRRSLAENLAREVQVTLPAEVIAPLKRIEAELLANQLSAESQQWLQQTGLKETGLAEFIDPLPPHPDTSTFIIATTWVPHWP